MNREQREEQFLDYIEGTLAAEERSDFEHDLKNSAELQRSLRQYQELLRVEAAVAKLSPEISQRLEQGIADQLNSSSRRSSVVQSLVEAWHNNRTMLTRSVASFAVLLLVVKLSWDTPPRQQSATPSNAIAGDVGSAVDEPSLPTFPKASEQNEVIPSGPVVAQPLPNSQSENDNKEMQVAVPAQPDSVSKMVAREESAAVAVAGAVRDPQFSSAGLGFGLPVIQGNVESYGTINDNLPADPHQKPLSTFSIDVDTASYANVRRYIRSRTLPPIDAVRAEEMINYFHYDYPSSSEEPFTLSYEVAPSPLERGKHLLKLGIKTRELQSQSREKPWNLVFLIDVSGSMADANKLPLLKMALPILVEQMRDGDRIAVVTYSGYASVALETTLGREKQRILNAINFLSASGSTNGSGGLELAYEVARSHFVQGGVNRIVLATDGDFNVGTTSLPELIRMIERQRATGVTLTTLGLGTGNIRDDIMEQLADRGDGNYFYLDSLQEARRVLSTSLTSNFEVVAKDVKLQVEFNPRQVAHYRLMGYENRALASHDFKNDSVDAGEIGPGHTVTALYELTLGQGSPYEESELRYPQAEGLARKSPPPSPTDELAFVKIRYKAPGQESSSLLRYPILTKEIRPSAAESSDDLRFAAAVGYFARLLRNRDMNAASSVSYSFDELLSLAQGARGRDPRGERQEFIELVRDTKQLAQVYNVQRGVEIPPPEPIN